ncbi:MAG: 50S ribosomal protein L10 [Gammaproteobacteria bacterium]|nr:50S ribosomal protein L10 [Gammaproteobacteria bacterium]
MSLTLKEKQAVVSEVNEVAANSQTAVAAEYIGLTVAQMTDLRAKARASGVFLRVVKNTLARRAVEGTSFECLKDSLTGPLLLVFSGEDPGAGARLVRDFSKDNAKLVTKVVAFAGEARPAEDLTLLANMPTLDSARAQLLGVLKAPQTKLVRTLAEPAGQVVRVLAAYRDAQQSA